MIPLDDPALYEASLRLLSEFVGRGYMGRLVQIFLAAKYLGPAIPRVGSGERVAIGELQTTLDDLYTKVGRLGAAQPSVVSIFRNNHVFPTGVAGAGLNGASNIWRNNFGLQKAMVCFATEAELLNPAFVMAPRLQCPHLMPPGNAGRGSLAGASCDLAQGALYRGEDHPKFVRRDPGDGGISIVDPDNLALWQNAIVPAAGRLPVVPLICALYHDSALAAGRAAVDTTDLALDFSFTTTDYHGLFDDDPLSASNQAMLGLVPAMTWTRIVAVPPAPAPAAVAPAAVAPPLAPGVRRPLRARVALEDLPNVAPPVAPPAGGHWWAAEQAVQQAMRDGGWTVIDRSRQGVGFDFEANRGGKKLYVEVKSSAGPCSPVLTRREYEAAIEHGNRYVLGVVEAFSPNAPARILWVRNPGAIPMVARQVQEYPLPRSRWVRQATPVLDV